jgi:5-methyltetrahydrofolate--homocysteine methyltransferase
MNKLEKLLESQEYILLDGAMGTMLFAVGLEEGAAPEAWNFEYPNRIREVHRAYIEAGSQVILTNTFGGTRYRLKLHGLHDQVCELNKAAAELARTEADAAPHPVVVAGSMGPTGELLVPMGTMTFEQARDAFAEQAKGLALGGVDALWVETMSDPDEAKAAVAGARSVSDLPIVATMSFDTHGRTMMGTTPEKAADLFSGMDIMAFGANCGANLPDTEAAVWTMHTSKPQALIIAKANAGIPHWEGDSLIYDGTPEVMAAYARRARARGARLIGGCCGSTAAHIRAMRDALTEPLNQDDFPGGTESRSEKAQDKVRRPSRRRRHVSK